MNIKKYYKTYRVLPPDYFYIENAGDGENTLSFYQSGTRASLNIPIQYSFDAINWQSLGTLNTTTLSDTPLQIKHTDKIFLRATTGSWCVGGIYITSTVINTTNNVNVGGNIMSLLYGQTFEDEKTFGNKTYTFFQFFKGLGPKLLSVNNLSLPATQLTNYCYGYMFEGCSSLTTAPYLPATTLVNYCYQGMFSSCGNLNYIKADFLTDPKSPYTINWVSRVSSTGTFVKNSAATWENTFGTSAIPTGWTVVTE